MEDSNTALLQYNGSLEALHLRNTGNEGTGRLGPQEYALYLITQDPLLANGAQEEMVGEEL